jgi:prepilin peptidase CpaA
LLRLFDPVAAALVVAASSAAAVVDLRTRRVPNVVTAGIAAVGLALAALDLTRVSLSAAAAGLVVGLLLMLPGHLLGGTGAGDVKLMAALGTLLGPAATAAAFVYTLMAGGVIVMIVAARRGRLRVTVARTATLVGTGGGNVAEIERPSSDNRFAYAPAIAIGACLAALGV